MLLIRVSTLQNTNTATTSDTFWPLISCSGATQPSNTTVCIPCSLSSGCVFLIPVLISHWVFVFNLSDLLQTRTWVSDQMKRRTQQSLLDSAGCSWGVTAPKVILKSSALNLEPQSQSRGSEILSCSPYCLIFLLTCMCCSFWKCIH